MGCQLYRAAFAAAQEERPQMIKLTDDELSQVFRCAQPLPVSDRDRFLKEVAERLAGTTVGPGSVFRICSEVQRSLLNGNYPTIGSGSWGKYR
jgi:hypothetical protein